MWMRAILTEHKLLSKLRLTPRLVTKATKREGVYQKTSPLKTEDCTTAEDSSLNASRYGKRGREMMLPGCYRWEGKWLPMPIATVAATHLWPSFRKVEKKSLVSPTWGKVAEGADSSSDNIVVAEPNVAVFLTLKVRQVKEKEEGEVLLLPTTPSINYHEKVPHSFPANDAPPLVRREGHEQLVSGWPWIGNEHYSKYVRKGHKSQALVYFFLPFFPRSA